MYYINLFGVFWALLALPVLAVVLQSTILANVDDAL